METSKEINDIKELRQAVKEIKKAAGVKRGEISTTTREGGIGLTLNIEVKKYTPTAAKAVKELIKLGHGDEEDDVMHDYWGSNHLYVMWGFKLSDLDEVKEWYTTDEDIETVKKVLSQKQDFIEPINDTLSASWSETPDSPRWKGYICISLFKTEGSKRLTYFTSYDHSKSEEQVIEFANYLARYRFLHEI